MKKAKVLKPVDLSVRKKKPSTQTSYFPSEVFQSLVTCCCKTHPSSMKLRTLKGAVEE